VNSISGHATFCGIKRYLEIAIATVVNTYHNMYAVTTATILNYRTKISMTNMSASSHIRQWLIHDLYYAL